ncbi:hypothetical protein [Thalassotalea ganghwensis]
MKGNYEHTVQSVLAKFEKQNQIQQNRLDSSHQQHIANLKQQHQSQLADKQAHIEQLTDEINYFKKQLAQKEHSLEQLNARYDAVMSCLLHEKQKDINIKDIFSDENLLFEIDSENNVQPDTNPQQDIESAAQQSAQQMFEQGITLRNQQDFDAALSLFEQAAQLGHAKAMGAMGRAYFLSEGCQEDHTFGLAWLIEAAKHNLEPAIERVNYFKESDAQLYHNALAINQALTSKSE